MSELVAHPKVNLENRYSVRVFGRRNWNEFLAWRDELKKNLTPEMEEAIGYIHAKSLGSSFQQMKLPPH